MERNVVEEDLGVPTKSAYIENRGGLPDLTEVFVRHWGFNINLGGYVRIGGVGVRGYEIRGGIEYLEPEAFDELCLKWLKARGFVVGSVSAQAIKEQLDQLAQDQTEEG